MAQNFRKNWPQNYRNRQTPKWIYARRFTSTSQAQWVAAVLSATGSLSALALPRGGAWDRVATTLVRWLGFAFVFVGVPLDACDRFDHALAVGRSLVFVVEPTPLSVALNIGNWALRAIAGALILAVGLAAWLEPWIRRRSNDQEREAAAKAVDRVFR